MKNKITKYIIYVLGILSLIIFVSVRLEKSPQSWINNKVIWEEKYGGYGDLYYLNLLDTFKAKVYDKEVSFSKTGNKNDINESDILFFGDSFLGGTASGNLFHERVGDTLNAKTFFSNDDNPLLFLSKANLIKREKRYLVFEIVERRIIDFFGIPLREEIKGGKILEIKKSLFPFDLETKYNYLFQKSILTYDLYYLINNLKFSLFRYINPSTPKYSLNPPFLFYFQEVNERSSGFYYKFKESEINTICDNIVLLADVLRKKYNLELVLLPVPNKYTIYHTVLNNDKYNNLLPVLYAKLKVKGISLIELYNDFINAKDTVYHSTDTHWNPKGEDIAINKLIKLLRK